MLIKVSIENFLSIKERVTLNMTPGRTKQHPSHVVRKNHRNGIDTLKSAIIFGPNASGKSNIIKAIDFAKKFIIDSTKVGNKIAYTKFKLDTEFQKSPSRIEFEIKHNSGKYYAYGFSFNNEKVLEEWLYEITSDKDKLIYEREDGSFKNAIEFFSSEEESFVVNTFKSVRDNQLALSVFLGQKTDDAKKSLKDILNVIDWFSNTLKIIFPESKVDNIESLLMNNNELQETYKAFFNAFNMGITDIEFSKHKLSSYNEIPNDIKENIEAEINEKGIILIKNNKGDVFIAKYEDGEISISKMQFIHKGPNDTTISFKTTEESDGTLRLIDLFPMLYDISSRDVVYIIDEIERSLHANATSEIFKIFFAISKNSQIIATTHETQLLSQLIFRKDEIWFVDKTTQGATSVTSLEQFKIRFDKEIRKDYIQGLFGGVPKYNKSWTNFILNNQNA